MAASRNTRITPEMRDAMQRYTRDQSTFHQLQSGRWIIAWWDEDHQQWCAPYTRAELRGTSYAGCYMERKARLLDDLEAHGASTYSTASHARRARLANLGY